LHFVNDLVNTKTTDVSSYKLQQKKNNDGSALTGSPLAIVKSTATKSKAENKFEQNIKY